MAIQHTIVFSACALLFGCVSSSNSDSAVEKVAPPPGFDLPDPNDDGSCTTDDGRDGVKRTCEYNFPITSNVQYDPTLFEIKTLTPGSSSCSVGIRMPSKVQGSATCEYGGEMSETGCSGPNPAVSCPARSVNIPITVESPTGEFEEGGPNLFLIAGGCSCSDLPCVTRAINLKISGLFRARASCPALPDPAPAFTACCAREMNQ